MLVEVKISSISYCPIYRKHVIILNGDDGRWLPVFLRDEDAGYLQALRQRNTVAIVSAVGELLKGMNLSILSVILHGVPHHPFLAKIEFVSAQLGRKEIGIHYAEAIALAIQTHAPILVEQEILTQASIVVDSERAHVRNELKNYLDDRMRPKGSRAVLLGQLQEAIQSEDYELATIIKEELKILDEEGAEKND